MPADDPRLVFATAPDSECARRLARALVQEHLAACANISGGVASVYRWKDAVQEDDEVLLIFKTRAELLPAFELRLAELHPYDVPECVSVAPDRVAAPYLAWLLDATA